MLFCFMEIHYVDDFQKCYPLQNLNVRYIQSFQIIMFHILFLICEHY